MLIRFSASNLIAVLGLLTAFPVHGSDFERCGTPAVVRMSGTAAKPAASARMDNLSKSAVSSAGRFRAHYDATGYNAPSQADSDFNGIPDYIDSTLASLEYAWNLEVTILGYPAPSGDNAAGGGVDQIDVYIKNYGINGGYGVTYQELQPDGSISAYMLIDNDFSESQYSTKGYPALRVTTAHEFFHVIHFSMKVSSDNLIWWMEQTATWMEDRAWPDVNDYIYYLGNFFANFDRIPLDSSSGSFMYGAVLWPTYLAKRFGDDTLRSIWETLAADANPGIALFDRVIPGGLAAALNEFGVWNYFTAGRADSSVYYPDAAKFGGVVGFVPISQEWPATGSLPTINLTSNYIACYFVGEWDATDKLKVGWETDSDRVHVNTILFYNTPSDHRVVRLERSDTNCPLGKKWDRAVLVTTCTNTTNPGGAFRFLLDRAEPVSVASAPIAGFAPRDARPNPFNASTVISFTMPAAGRAKVSVYDLLGRVVENLLDTRLSAGETAVLWKPSDLAAGVYMVRIDTPFGSRTVKTLYLK